jgi:hypothetical protein
MVGPSWAAAQTPDHLQHVDKQLAEKRAAAEAHRKQMEGVKDPDQLTVEMRRHFQMTEEMLALMLERKRLTNGQAGTSASPSPGQPKPAPQPGMQGGMRGDMKQKEMGGMQGGGAQGGGMQGMGGMRGGMMEKEMGGMKGGGMQGMSGQPQPQPSQTQPGDTDQMMQRIAEHSRYMETMQDRAALAQEMLRHQKMLDQMLELMQR